MCGVGSQEGPLQGLGSGAELPADLLSLNIMGQLTISLELLAWSSGQRCCTPTPRPPTLQAQGRLALPTQSCLHSSGYSAPEGLGLLLPLPRNSPLLPGQASLSNLASSEKAGGVSTPDFLLSGFLCGVSRLASLNA